MSPANLGSPIITTLLLLLASPLPTVADPLGPCSRRTDWVISEIQYQPAAREDGRQTEFVEIYNAGLIAEDLAGHRLAGELEGIFPPNTVIPAGGFLVVAPNPADVQAVYSLNGVVGGFTGRLNNAGGSLRLVNPAGAVLLEIAYRPTPPWPAAAAGSGHSLVLHRPSYGEADPRAWAASAQPGGSPGELEPQTGETPPPAAPPPSTDPESPKVIINEILYHPLDDTGPEDDEFVELHNPGNEPVNLGGWRLADAVEFEFPAGARLEPGGYAVVGRNAAHLRQRHAVLNAGNTFGDYRGNLANSGERLALLRPPPNPADEWLVVDEVTYADGGDWGRWSDGGGSSLELIDARADNRWAGHWADSDETGKAEWTVLEATGVLDQGTGAINQLQVLSQGAGQYLIDDVEVLDATGENLLANGGFNSGTAGWVMEGTLSESAWEATEGASGPGCLHIRAVARGDTGANRIRTGLRRSLSPGSTATLRARVRWLSGHPELLLRLRGNYLEAFTTLKTPITPGTPGARNSRVADNAGPAVASLRHEPVLPEAGESVRVMARLSDPDGIGSATVRYRLDPSSSTLESPLRDDGTGGDPVAGDGVYTATLPGQSSGRLVAFQVVVTDRAAPAAATVYPEVEALIRFGEVRPVGGLGTYRLWMTQATFNTWSARAKLDNTPLPVTFVYNDERVVYGTRALFAGSPHLSPGYSTPSGNLCGYVLHFPKDEPFLGATEVVLDWPGRDATAQQEPMAYWIARELGIPFNHRRFIRLHVNGVSESTRGSIYEDAQQVNADLVASWLPDGTDGDLFKIEQWFEFDDNLGRTATVPPRLENYTTQGGAKKLARYRWTWLKRAARGSANDYRRLFTLVDVANASDPEVYQRQTDAFVDMEEWMRVFATENIVVNLDAWGYDIGKNMYAYRPPVGRWQLFMWDIDWVMLASAQHGYSPTSPLMYRGPAVFGEGNRDPVVGRMYAQPAFQRAYWRAIQDAINGPLLPERVAARMDAVHAALVAHRVTRSSGSTLSAPTAVKTWLRQRRDFLIGELAAVEAPFTLDQPPGSIAGTNLLTLQGTAPIAAHHLQVNGVPLPTTWTSFTGWRLQVPLIPGANSLVIDGLDRYGHPLPSAHAEAQVRFEGERVPAADALVINEIQYRPNPPAAPFVEVHNRSSSTAFDLSGWRLAGVDTSFPSGTLLPPKGFLVAAADREALVQAYGVGASVDATFGGRLNEEGETLSLLQPDSPGTTTLTVDRVRFETRSPWPVPGPGTGASLQVIDATQDTRHPGNWAVALAAEAPDPISLVPIDHTWRYRQDGTFPGTDWTSPSFDDRGWATGGGLLYHESAGLPGPKTTKLNLGALTYYFRSHFNFDGDPSTVSLALTTIIDDGAVFYLNGDEIFRLGMPDGPIQPTTLAARTTSDAVQEGAFQLPATSLVSGDNVLAAEVHQINASSSDIVFGLTLDTQPLAQRVATPAAPNSVRTPLPGLPNLWINELQVDNQSGPRDAQGDRDPWVEIINTGLLPARLDDCYLADTISSPRRWHFPHGIDLPPGGLLLVWLDGEPEETTATEWHASLRPNATSGSIVLIHAPAGAQAIALDAVHYAALPPDSVVALIPDGHNEDRRVLNSATPGRLNLAVGPVAVVINEWMPANQSSVADPADGDFEDWFELYNPSNAPADLTGYSLTDDPGNPRKFILPAGTLVPALGFLLVWADEETGQNLAGSDLHVNFRLNRDGETIALIDPLGATTDEVQFHGLLDDHSGGRWPDGGTLAASELRSPTPGAPNTPPTPAEGEVRFVGVTVDTLGVVTLTWSSAPGAKFQVQAADDPVNGPWLDLGPLVTAPGVTASAMDQVTDSTERRFYRLRSLP